MVAVTLAVGPRPLVATLTQQDLERVKDILDDTVQADRRGEYSRIKLGSAMRAAIGHDPFTPSAKSSAKKDAAIFPVALAVTFVAFGFGFAVSHSSIWLQLVGYGFAAIAAADLIGRFVRHFRGSR
jgi:hypothetical protein